MRGGEGIEMAAVSIASEGEGNGQQLPGEISRNNRCGGKRSASLEAALAGGLVIDLTRYNFIIV